MLELLAKLCTLDGVSGNEEAVRDFIRTSAAPFADEVTEDASGNLIVFKKGRRSGRRVMLAAHMDEVGFIVKRITDDGILKFGLVGGFDPKVLIGRRVRLCRTGTPGVIGIKAVHLTTEEERKNTPKTDDLYIDIGAKNREEAEKQAAPGDSVAFDSDFVRFGDGFIKAKALDDRIGCAVMLRLLAEELPCDTYFAFTVQEEVGCRGAITAAYRVKPEIALVIEGTTAADLPGADEDKKVCFAGRGAVLSFRDGGAMYDLRLFRMMCACADRLGIRWQTKQLVAGGTDARSIQVSRSGVRIAGVSAPVRYIHSASSVVKESDLGEVYHMAQAFLTEVNSDGSL